MTAYVGLQIAILARQIKQNVTSVILLNNVPAKAASIRKFCSYVPQLDVLLPTATVSYLQRCPCTVHIINRAIHHICIDLPKEHILH